MNRKVVVGIDVRDLKVAKTGAKTYLEELLKIFKRTHQEVTFHFFDSRIPIYTGRNRFLKAIEHIRFNTWKQLILPCKAFFKNCDILFCTDYFVPYIKLGYQTIPVFHDAFFFEYPKQYNYLWLLIFKTFGIRAAKRSVFIVTPTQYARQQLIKYMDIDPQKFIVIPEAPKTLPDHSAEQQYNRFTFEKKYILHVGTLEKRKNLTRLIEAFYVLHQNGYKNLTLVFAGQASPKKTIDDSANIKAVINKFNLAEYVYLLGYLNDTDLAGYYKNATVYVFPSVNEGFGLPVLEAFHHQLPVLVANNTCLPEVGGNAVMSFDPYDTNDLVQKMKLVLDDPAVRLSLKHKGLKRLAHFSWEKTGSQLINLFINVAQKNKGFEQI